MYLNSFILILNLVLSRMPTQHLIPDLRLEILLFLQEFLGALFILFATSSTLVGALLLDIDPSWVGLSSAYALQVSLVSILDLLE